jgi:hypothetical protein
MIFASSARPASVSGATRFLLLVVVGSSGLAPDRFDHFLQRLTPKLV